MKKIGILGGTFNPIHNAHRIMAQAAYEQYQLDEVWFMPSKEPPHKKKDNIVSKEHRCRMIQFAIDGVEHFSLSSLELQREGITYTCDTLKQCADLYPNVAFYFILGGDSLRDFETWYHPEKIASLCTILAFARDGMTEKQLERRCKQLSQKLNGRFLPVQMPQMTVSSREIRDMFANNKTPYGLLPDVVMDYINFHNLYREECSFYVKDKKKWNTYLAATLRPKRYEHTVGVANTAFQLAIAEQEDMNLGERAKQAGLLHDCAKYLTDKEMLSACQKYKIALTEIEKKNTVLIHGKLGAYLAKTKYCVKDEEVLSAIYWHTTGKPGMSLLEKIIYVADYIEPGRNMKYCYPYSLEKIRKMSFVDIECGFRMVLQNKLEYLRKQTLPIDTMTIKTYEYYFNEAGH